MANFHWIDRGVGGGQGWEGMLVTGTILIIMGYGDNNEANDQVNSHEHIHPDNPDQDH